MNFVELPDLERALRDDIRLVGRVLGETVRQQQGEAVYETVERIRLLTTENAQLRAELGSLKDRLTTLERIATDQPSKLAREIEQLQ